MKTLFFSVFIILIYFNHNVLGMEISNDKQNLLTKDASDSVNLVEQWFSQLSKIKQKQLKDSFNNVSNYSFNQDKFDTIKKAMNEHPLISSDYYFKQPSLIVSDTHLVEYFYANNLGINISHQEVMYVTNHLNSQALWTTFWTFLFVELPVLSNWKEEEFQVYGEDYPIYKIPLTTMPLAIFTMWSTLLAIPFVTRKNALLHNEIHIDDNSEPLVRVNSLRSERDKTNIWSLLKLTDLTHDVGAAMHSLSIFIKGNQLKRGFLCGVALSIVANILLNQMVDYVGLQHIPPDNGPSLFPHRLLLCVKAWGFDFSGTMKGWNVRNIFYNNVNWGRNFRITYGKKLTANLVLFIALFVIKFFKFFLVGCTVKFARQENRYVQKIVKWFTETFLQKYDPTPGSKMANFKKMINPMMVLFTIATLFHLLDKQLTLSNSPVANDFGDFSCIPAALAMLYPLQYFQSIAYWQVSLNSKLAKQNENQTPFWANSNHAKIKAIELWIKKNSRNLIFYSLYALLFSLLSYGGIGIQDFEGFWNPIVECVANNITLYYFLAFGANGMIRIFKIICGAIEQNEQPDTDNNDVIAPETYTLSKKTLGVTFSIFLIFLMILNFIPNAPLGENIYE